MVHKLCSLLLGMVLSLVMSCVVFAAPVHARQPVVGTHRMAAPATALQSLTQYLQGIHSMTAEFKQEVRDETGTLLQMSQGRMAWQRPDLFKWQVIEPDQQLKQLMLADGKWLWIYSPKLSQVIKQSLSHREGTPVSLLSGSVASIGRQFVVTKHREKQMIVYHLQPKDPQAPFVSIELQVEDAKMVGMQFKDKLALTTTYFFSNITTNQSLPKAVFEFSPPPSVTIEDQTT